MTFEDLNLNSSLLKALNDLGITQPTGIQQKSFSAMMSGADVVGIAQTGTGKTFAYLLPTLRQWTFSKEKRKDVQILILVPTRELVTQVVEQVEKLTTYMQIHTVGVYGGTNINTQKELLVNGCDVLVATPGRLLDLILSGALKVKAVKKLVIDEVDEMLSLGFRPQLTRVMDLLPPKRQNLMFSATMTEEVEAFIADYFNNPAKIEAAPTGTPLENINQTAYEVPNFNTKINLLTLLLAQPEMKKVMLFTSSKQFADLIYDRLQEKFSDQLGVIHSNKSQNNRFESVNRFKDGSFRVLIATDIVSRGLDISEVTHVINFDTPDDPENYMHRIGRSGRADKKGEAITFFTTEKDEEMREAIEALMNREILTLEVPEEVEISEVLIEGEIPQAKMKEIRLKTPKREDVGPAFHEKSLKNQKVNNKIRRAEGHRLKYGKSKTTRGKKKR